MSEQQPPCYIVRQEADLDSEEIQNYANVSIINIYFKKLDYIPVHIQILKINHCSLQSLKNLRDLERLQHLDISFNLVSDLSEILLHQELTYLDISNNCVIVIDPVSVLNKLQTLIIANNMIMNIEPLIHHINFDPVWIQPQNIPVRHDFAKMLTPGADEQTILHLMQAESEKKCYSDYLTMMIKLLAPCVKNGILAAKNVDDLVSIAFIDCFHVETVVFNSCKHISFTELPKKVKHLSITNSCLKRIEGLEKMTQLESIDLSGNNLITCEILSKLKLKAVNLTRNKIIDLKHVQQFIQFQNTFISEQEQPTLPDIKKYLGQEGTEAQIKQIFNEMQLNIVSNEEAIHDSIMVQKYRNNVKQGGILEISNDQTIKSPEFVQYIGISGENGITMLKVIGCNNLILEHCPQSAYSSLTKLTVNNCGLKNLNGIQIMIQLKELNLSLNLIIDISMLAPLVHLQVLDLGKNNIKQISVLSNFKQLNQLDLSENLIEDISSLKNLQQMQILDLSYNNIKCVSDLVNLIKITKLNLSRNNIFNIEALSNMMLLKYLNISVNRIISISICSKFNYLSDLRIEYNLIQDFEPIFKHKLVNRSWIQKQNNPTDIDYINAFNCSEDNVQIVIQKIQEQKEMSDNKYMLIKKYQNEIQNNCLKINGENYLNNLQITDILKLKRLEAINCQILDFKEDQVPLTLTQMKLNKCTFKNTHYGINMITGIYQMEQLVELDLAFNQIRDILEIGNLSNLQKLYLQNNEIYRVHSLNNLKKLTYLNIQNNKIIFSEPLKQLQTDIQKDNQSQVIFGEQQFKGFNQEKLIMIIDNNLIVDNLQLSNQDAPHSADYKNFLGPNSSDDQVKELALLAGHLYYSLKMLLKYSNNIQYYSNTVQSVGHGFTNPVNNMIQIDYIKSLHIINDNELIDFGFTYELNVQILKIEDCINVKLPRILTNHLLANDQTLTNYQEVKLIQLPTKITWLSITNSNLMNLVGLELLPQLQKIELINNPLTQIQSIFSLSKVTYLKINNTKLADISGLQQMKQLVELDLGFNLIKEIHDLKYLINLKKLIMQNNEISRIIALRDLNQLDFLNISNNKIIFSEPICNLKLQLQIENNLVSDNTGFYNQGKPQFCDYKNFIGPNSTDNEAQELSEIISKTTNTAQMKRKYANAVQYQQLIIQNDLQLIDFGFTSEINVTSLIIKNCPNTKLPITTKYFQMNNGILVNYPEVKYVIPTQIVQLVINNSKITNLIGIENIKQLQYADFRDNSIISVEPLQRLVNIKHLILDGNFIQDIQFITVLPNYKLEWVYYQRVPTDADYQNYLNDINSLATITELKTALASKKTQTDKFIAQITKYETEMHKKYQQTVQNQTLQINGDVNVKDFRFVDQLPIMNLQFNTCINIKFLRTPTKIVQLTITYSQLTNLIGIETMKQLQFVDFRNNSIISVEPIKQLTKCQKILLDNNAICDMENITSLPNYTSDWIYYQRIATDTELANYLKDTNSQLTLADLKAMLTQKIQNTKQLILRAHDTYDTLIVQKYQNAVSWNQLKIENDSELKDFKAVERLPVLNLQLNNCININLRRTPSKIISLTINNSKITNLIGIENIKQLQYADFRDNSIISVEPLQRLVNIKHLILDGNFIQDIQFITVLPNKLEWVYYQRVPTDADYQNYLNDINSLATITELKTALASKKTQTDKFIAQITKYETEMHTKYQQTVQNQTLQINGDVNVKDFRFVDQLPIMNLQFNALILNF
ncbi:Conserved_hypothetical protein [Hexamita inflata]|uniref:Chaoptin n=1 Tax=Hexamita inflata TaxID=28002 RepID=A0AA86P2D3_9EUKA|nr:Conserved hypothetical protein [Hexamita inflata]